MYVYVCIHNYCRNIFSTKSTNIRTLWFVLWKKPQKWLLHMHHSRLFDSHASSYLHTYEHLLENIKRLWIAHYVNTPTYIMCACNYVNHNESFRQRRFNTKQQKKKNNKSEITLLNYTNAIEQRRHTFHRANVGKATHQTRWVHILYLYVYNILDMYKYVYSICAPVAQLVMACEEDEHTRTVKISYNV